MVPHEAKNKENIVTSWDVWSEEFQILPPYRQVSAAYFCLVIKRQRILYYLGYYHYPSLVFGMPCNVCNLTYWRPSKPTSRGNQRRLAEQQVTLDRPSSKTPAVLSSKSSTNVAMFFEIMPLAILCFGLLFANAYFSWEDDICFWDDPWEFPEESGEGTLLTWFGSTEVWADLWNWLSQPREFARPFCN